MNDSYAIVARRLQQCIVAYSAVALATLSTFHAAPLRAGTSTSTSIAAGQVRACRTQPATDSAALAVEHEWVAAIKTRDMALLACIIDPSFIDTDWRGVLRTRATVLGEPPAAPSKYRQTYGDFTTQRVGDVVIIRGMNTVSDSSGRELQHIRFTDVLRYVNHRWRAVSAQETMVREEQQG